ncbi:putative membrane protein [Brucella pseudogrignonensis]|uniref:Membrane protein n=2 Tax=Brucella pseudogrignonensis TaxID=419475 RepID=A0ABU1MB78_9HYPH|nr:putative membrane protein [Brucella pseudogrignonensis]
MMNAGAERGEFVSLIAPILEPMASALEFFGVAVIIIGVAVATIVYCKDVFVVSGENAYTRYRANLGRGILLGLEILIGADIIATIISPLTWESVGLLGLIVLIRTFLSFSLEAEIDGEWPWKRRSREHRS